MQWRAHFAPVAIVELIAVARRWQTYVARAGLVLALGLTLGLVCLSYQSGVLLIGGHLKLREYAEAGTNFAVAVLSVQLALVLFAAPAGAAGAICLDKTRGNLTLLLASDMTAFEFVIGKLFGRLLPVLALVIVSVPVLFITSFLGGINAELIGGGFVVLVGAGVLGSAIALLMSLYVGRTHEALLLSFFLLFGWMILKPLAGFIPALPGTGPIARWLWATNPVTLLLAPLEPKLGVGLSDYVLYLTWTFGLATIITLLAIVQLRRVVLRQANRPIRLRGAKSFHRQRAPKLLDRDPLRWYERYRNRPSLMARMTRLLIVLVALTATAAAIFLPPLFPGFDDLPASACAAMVGIGLLLVVIRAVSSLADERSRGSLDILATTPYTTPAILWAKWRAAFAVAPWLLLLPWLIAFAVWWQRSYHFKRYANYVNFAPDAVSELIMLSSRPFVCFALLMSILLFVVMLGARCRVVFATVTGLTAFMILIIAATWWEQKTYDSQFRSDVRGSIVVLAELVLVFCQPLACAAMLTSLGLFLALQMKNFGRAVGLATAFYIGLSLGWVFFLRLLGASGNIMIELQMLSPVVAIGMLIEALRQPWPNDGIILGAVISIGVNLAAAAYFYSICLIIANRKMGRISRTESRPIPPIEVSRSAPQTSRRG